jgi:hypothetical protein
MSLQWHSGRKIWKSKLYFFQCNHMQNDFSYWGPTRPLGTMDWTNLNLRNVIFAVCIYLRFEEDLAVYLNKFTITFVKISWLVLEKILLKFLYIYTVLQPYYLPSEGCSPTSGPNVIKFLSILKKILNSNICVREWGSWEFYKSVYT